ncbi:hypothetical protein Tco_1059403 [Tanacetum coccineum]
MLSLYIRCSTDESRWYLCTLDVQRMIRYVIVVYTPAKYSRQALFFTIRAVIILRTTNRSHTLLPSQPPTDHNIIMKMVSYEAFVCRCGAEDVALRESYKPKTCGKLYYACPQSKPREDCFGCEFFIKEERVRLLVSSPGASTTPIYSPGPSTPPSYSP